MSMVLIKSISGIRGTLGDDENSLNLTICLDLFTHFHFSKEKKIEIKK